MQQARLTHPHINFKKERSFSEKLNATFAFLSQNIKPIGTSLLYVAGPFALLAGLFYGIYQSFTGLSGQNPFENAGNLPLLVTGLAGFIVFGFIAGTLVIALVFRHIRCYVEEGHSNLNIGFLWKTIWKDFFSLVGTSLFIMLAFFVCIFLIAIPMGILIPVVGSPVVGGILAVFLMFALMVAMAGFFLLYPIRSMERKGVFAATSRLFRIISGKWLSTIGLVIVTSLIQMVISLVFAIPAYIIMFLQYFHDGEFNLEAESSSPLYNILLAVFSGLSMVGSFSLYSILFVAITFQYFNLVERKDASGLLERMERFGQAQPVTEDHEEQY